MAKRSKSGEIVPAQPAEYVGLVSGISELLDSARRSAARCVNSIMTPPYWEIGRRIVEYEQRGLPRAEYGKEVLKRLGKDLSARHGRGFSWRNLFRMRAFYLAWDILPTASAKFEAWARLPSNVGGGNEILPTLSAISEPKMKPPQAAENGGDEICSTVSGKFEIPQAKLNPSLLYCSRSGLSDPLVTRSVSEAMSCGPRLRFGSRSVSTVGSITRRVSEETTCGLAYASGCNRSPPRAV